MFPVFFLKHPRDDVPVGGNRLSAHRARPVVAFVCGVAIGTAEHVDHRVPGTFLILAARPRSRAGVHHRMDPFSRLQERIAQRARFQHFELFPGAPSQWLARAE